MSRPAFTWGRADVALVQALASGKVRAEILDRERRPTGRFVTGWPHEFRCHPGGLAAIKQAIAELGTAPAPADAPASAPADTRQDPPHPRGFLHAHHAAGSDDREEQHQ